MSLKLRSIIPYGNFDSLVAALAGFWLIQICARHGGIGVSPDSVVYMSTAASIHDHSAINDFTGLPMMDFPAFYPLFLSGVQFLTGHSPLSYGPVLNGLLFGVLIFLCGWMMEQFTWPLNYLKVKPYKWILLSCILFSPCLLEVYCMIWSETLFLLLLLIFIICARRYFLSHTTAALLWMGLVAALACVTRYAGVSFILLGELLILCDEALTWKKKIGHGLLFGLAACSLLVLNIYRNRLVTGTLTGYREKAIVTFGTNLHDYGSVLCDWMPFTDEDFSGATWVGAFFILFCTGLFLYRLIRKRDFFSYENIALSFFVVYSVFILATASLSRFQQLDSRLLSPLFIPWLWGSTSWIVDVLQGRALIYSRYSIQWRLFLMVGSLALAISFQVGQWRVNAENWEGVKYAGIPGYTEDQWKKSETMAYIRGHQELFGAGTPTFSNAYEGIWFFTGLRTEMLPHRDLPWDVKEFLNEKQFYVVWFDDAINTDLVTIGFITQHKRLVNTLRFHDGTIYYFTTEALAEKPEP
ncbi:MAG TPA: hypothetical protein VL832_20305 [Puia sp.]|nr:hypothetical protein [Puia sp.]